MKEVIELDHKDFLLALHSDESSPFEMIKNDINSIDEEDGGHHNTSVFKVKEEDDVFYMCDYTGWEVDHNDGELFSLVKVEKKTRTVEYYE